MIDFSDNNFEQPDLFNEKRLNQNYRTLGPTTSKLAGNEVRKSGKASKQIHIIEYLVIKYPGKSSKQLEKLSKIKEPLRFRLTHTQIGKRVNESKIVKYDESKILKDGCHPLIVI